MRQDPRLEALFASTAGGPRKPVGLLQKIGAIAVAVVVFGLALTFSLLFFALVVAVGLVVWGYLWWRTRDLRKAMREAQARAQGHARAARGPGQARRGGEGVVIEGEVVREVRDAPREDGRG